MHLRSAENRMNFTDYKNLNCYKYAEENAIFLESNTSETSEYTTTANDTFRVSGVSHRRNGNYLLDLEIEQDKLNYTLCCLK